MRESQPLWSVFTIAVEQSIQRNTIRNNKTAGFKFGTITLTWTPLKVAVRKMFDGDTFELL